jgi:hypothetical protein
VGFYDQNRWAYHPSSKQPVAGVSLQIRKTNGSGYIPEPFCPILKMGIDDFKPPGCQRHCGQINGRSASPIDGIIPRATKRQG